MASDSPSEVRWTDGSSGLPPNMNRKALSPGSRSHRLTSSESGDVPARAPYADTSAANEGGGESASPAVVISAGLGATSIWCSETDVSAVTACSETLALQLRPSDLIGHEAHDLTIHLWRGIRVQLVRHFRNALLQSDRHVAVPYEQGTAR